MKKVILLLFVGMLLVGCKSVTERELEKKEKYRQIVEQFENNYSGKELDKKLREYANEKHKIVVKHYNGKYELRDFKGDRKLAEKGAELEVLGEEIEKFNEEERQILEEWERRK